MHDNLFVRNVSFAIRKRTFASTNLNGHFGWWIQLFVATLYLNLWEVE